MGMRDEPFGAQHTLHLNSALRWKGPLIWSLTPPDWMLLLLSSQFWPILSMSRRVINCAILCRSHPFSRIKWIRQCAVDRDPVLTSTTSAKIGKTAIGVSRCLQKPNPESSRAPIRAPLEAVCGMEGREASRSVRKLGHLGAGGQGSR